MISFVGFPLKAYVLDAVLNFPGEKAEIIEEVRKQLPDWKGKNFSHDTHIGFLIGSIRLLASAGGEEDLELIELFVEHENGMLQARAKQYLPKLIARLEEEARNPKSHVLHPSPREPKSRGRSFGEIENDGDQERGGKWLLILAAIVFLFAILLLMGTRAARRS